MANQTLDNPQRNLALAGVAFVLAFALWQLQDLSLITYPFRLFVTMIHEMGHGLGAILTGGSFDHFEVTKRGAGLAYTHPGSRFVIIQAGYVGTAIFGAGLLILTHRVAQPRIIAVGLGVIIGAMTLLFTGISVYQLSIIELVVAGGVLAAGGWYLLVSDETEPLYRRLGGLVIGATLVLMFAGRGNHLTIVVGLISALLLIFLGAVGSRGLIVGVLTFLAFLTGLQAISDAWVLLRIVQMPAEIMPHNDAVSMAHEVGGSATLWALIWIAMDIILFGVAAYVTLLKPWRDSRSA